MAQTPYTGSKRRRSPQYSSSSSSHESPILTDFQREIRAYRLKLAQIIKDDIILQREQPDAFLDFLDETKDMEDFQEILSASPRRLSSSELRRLNNPYYSDEVQYESESGDEFFSDSPTEENYPMTFQKAHGTGVTRDTKTSTLIQKLFVGRDLSYLDLHNTNQNYGPAVYQGQIFPSFISAIHEGYSTSSRQSNSVFMHRLTIHLQIILPDRTVNELSAGLLNDELRILIIKDSQPNPKVPEVTDVLSVHDSHHTINAFINPATVDRFTVLYDTSFFMQYTTLWELSLIHI